MAIKGSNMWWIFGIPRRDAHMEIRHRLATPPRRHARNGALTPTDIRFRTGKFIHVKFPHREEKKFIIPNAFIVGHLVLE